MLTQTTYDRNGKALAQTVHTMGGSPLDALKYNGNSCDAWNEGLELQTDYGSPSPLRTVQNTYATQTGCRNNPQLSAQTTILQDTSQQSQVTFSYDQYFNVTDQKVYNWGSKKPSTTLLREEKTTYAYLTAPSNGVPVSILDLPSIVQVTDGTNVLRQTNFTYDQRAPADAPGISASGHDSNFSTAMTSRGNLWNTADCLNAPTCSSWVHHPMSYDIAGNVVSITAGDGVNVTKVNYNDDGQDYYALPTSVVNPLGQKTSATYDYNIGKPLTTTDPNGNTTKYQYSDPLNRVTGVLRPDGGSSYFAYPDPNHATVAMDQSAAGDESESTQTAYDGLGRQTSVYKADFPQQGIPGDTVTTTYDAAGRIASTTENNGLPLLTTNYSYDSLGRVTSLTTSADSDAVTASYSGSSVTRTDQAGNQRTSISDASGRLAQVVEDPNGKGYTTSYAYNPAGNLVLVSQGQACPATPPAIPGQGCRYFTYDSLGRLTSTSQPESLSTSYTYDADNNVLTQTDARGVKSTMTYDALGRTTKTVYSGGSVSTPYVTFVYDTGATNGIGQLTSSTVNGGPKTTYNTFDVLGRVTSSTRTIGSNSYSLSYAYDLAGNLVAETYPSGRVIKMVYDPENRPVQVTDQNGQNGQMYAFGSWSFGNQLASINLNNGILNQSYAYNKRRQLQSITAIAQNASWSACPNNAALSLQMFWGTGGTQTASDNGNLYGQNISACNVLGRTASFAQTYSYDSLNRIQKMTDSGGASEQDFSYDPYGNMWATQSGTFPVNTATPSSNVCTAQNQLSTATYDQAGNQLSIPSSTGALKYDAENRVVSWSGTNAATYAYDAGRTRVSQTVAGVTTVYVYDDFGQLVAEYSSNVTAAPTACDLCFITSDHLGTPRLITDVNGDVVSFHDFMAFGEELISGYAGRANHVGKHSEQL